VHLIRHLVIAIILTNNNHITQLKTHLWPFC